MKARGLIPDYNPELIPKYKALFDEGRNFKQIVSGGGNVPGVKEAWAEIDISEFDKDGNKLSEKEMRRLAKERREEILKKSKSGKIYPEEDLQVEDLDMLEKGELVGDDENGDLLPDEQGKGNGKGKQVTVVVDGEDQQQGEGGNLFFETVPGMCVC